MKKLTRKESMAIATIHDALRELHIKGYRAHVVMCKSAITISIYPNSEKEARQLNNLLCFFKDDEDTIKTRHYPVEGDCPEFYMVELEKMMV